MPPDLSDTVVRGNDTLYLRGRGDWTQCQDAVRPFLGLHNGTMSPGGVYQVAPAQRPQTRIFKWLNSPAPLCLSQAPINFTNSEFYGFSELFYCTEDVLRLGGPYDSHKYSRAAAVNGLRESASL